MSQLREKLEWAPTGQRIALREPLAHIITANQSWERLPHLDADEYRLGVRLEVRAVLTAPDLHNGTPHADITRQARRQVIEAVFGEFRPQLLAIECALMERDHDKAREAVQQLRAAMFGD